MNTLLDICKEELDGRIGQLEMLLKSAKSCLKDQDYFQCAIRLQMAGDQGKFSDFQMDVFENISNPKSG